MQNLRKPNPQHYKTVMPPWLLALFLLTGAMSVADSLRSWREATPPRPHTAAIATSTNRPASGAKGDWLNFDLPDLPNIGGDIKAGWQRFFQPAGQLEKPLPLPPELEPLFAGGSQSLVARAIGAAEGTRLPSGEQTDAYFGHIDPGNGVWNQGTFSYQHEADSPEEADRKQTQRLRRQMAELHHWAKAVDAPWGLEEQLNALDLANQAPLAALSTDGYLDRLQEAYAQGFNGSDAILQARVYAYLDPATNRWNAPGLGNTLESITADQKRRQSAIDAAIAVGELP
ncbi:MAG: hypothetical protein AAF289_19425 [Cyanobacteria bacterium P01_A01_bin.135]